jgi:Sulfotransferase domain
MQQPKNVTLNVSAQEQKLALQVKEEVDLAVAKLQQGNDEMAAALLKRTLLKTPVHFPGYDIVVHNLLTAYRSCIARLLKSEDVTPVNPFLQDAFTLQLRGQIGQDPEFRQRFADLFYNMGKDFYQARQWEASLACVRKAIAIQPCPSYYVDLSNALGFTKTRARLEDYTQAYPPDKLGRHLFIACAPKSGSTFLKNVLVTLTGFKDLFSVYAALQNEHELDLPQLAKFGNVNTVTQQHSRASEANIHLMQAFNIRPVVLVRDIFDTVISLLDFYRGGFTFSTYFDREDFNSFDQDQQIDLLIEYVLPWYFQFVASWQRVERERRLKLYWLTYENMIADKIGTVDSVLFFYGMQAPREKIEEVINSAESDNRANRFNKGVAGRGKVGLTEMQKDRIILLARHYPKNDFSCLGL